MGTPDLATPGHRFYDSSRWGLIPAGEDAALYLDGRFACPPAKAKRFRRSRWITVLGGAKAARRAGIADYEPGNAVFEIPGRLREFVEERIRMQKRARVYSNRADLEAAMRETHGLRHEWWISTLDGNRLSADWIEGLWGVQHTGGPDALFDESVLYGDW